MPSPFAIVRPLACLSMWNGACSLYCVSTLQYAFTVTELHMVQYPCNSMCIAHKIVG